MDAEAGVPERITGRRLAMSRRERRITTVAVLVYAALLAWSLSRGSWSVLGGFSVFVVMVVIGAFRGPTEITAEGIRRPWRRRSSVLWSDVDRIARPQPGIPTVQLWMKSGATLNLDDISADRTDEVSRLAGVPVGFSTHPRVSPPVRPNATVAAADLDRRVRAFDERSRALDAEYRRIRGGRPDT